jgi:hypothetical protein
MVTVTPTNARSSSTYRLSTAHLLRSLGALVIGLGALWVVVAVSGLTGVIRGLLALVTLVIVLLALVLLVRPPRVLELSADGYRISLVRGAGVARSAWTEVESVGTQTRGSALCLVFNLKGEATSTLPLSLLGTRNVEAQREVHERLNDAHGYRRL